MINIKSLGKAEVFFISVASPVFSENPPKFHQKSQIYRTPLTGGLAKRSAKIKITPIPNSSLIPCFDMLPNKGNIFELYYKYLTSSAAAAAAGAAPPAAAAGAAPAPDPTLATRSLMLTDSRHLAKRPGQKGSTVTLAAFKMVLIFSA